MRCRATRRLRAATVRSFVRGWEQGVTVGVCNQEQSGETCLPRLRREQPIAELTVVHVADEPT